MGGDDAESRRGCCLLPTCLGPALERGTKPITVPVVPGVSVVPGAVLQKPLRSVSDSVSDTRYLEDAKG